MEEIGKRRVAAAGAVAAGLAYFLVCAFPLQKELVLVPAWTKSLDQAPASPSPPKNPAATSAAEGAQIPFRLGERFGYFTPDGSILFAEAASYGVAISPDAFATYERLSEGFSIESPEGEVLAHVSSVGYPFFDAGRHFVIGPDQTSVSELTKGGTTAWTYQFTSVVTAFDASSSIAAFGLMDGSIVGLDGSGAVLLNFAPGGSRVAGVYGVAVSPDGVIVAAVTGLDKQRLIVMEKRSAAYRVAYHRYLASDYRRPVAMAFTADGRLLAFESPAGVGVYDRSSRSETVISVPAASRLGLTTREGKLMVLLSGSGEEKRLVCAALPDRRLFDLPLRAKLAFVDAQSDAQGGSIFLGLDQDLVRMDLRER
jgi:hypothetical protein